MTSWSPSTVEGSAVTPISDPERGFGHLSRVQIVTAALASIGIWWMTTAVLMYFNSIPGAQPFVALVSLVLAIVAGVWLLRNRDRTGIPAVYMSFTAGLLLWAFCKSSLYSGYVVGLSPDPLALPPVDGPTMTSFLQVLGLSIYHELLALGLAVVAIWQARKAENPFGFHIFLMLFAFAQSAKLNVFFGVVNTGSELLPDTVSQLRPYMTEATMNPFFPVSITVITVITWALLRRSLDTGIPKWRRVGYLLIGTMASLALLEHWFLMIPFDGGAVVAPGQVG